MKNLPIKNSEPKDLARDISQIGGVIRKLRYQFNLTQADAAALCKVSPKFLSDLENGKINLRLSTLMQVLSAFGLTVLIQRRGSHHE